MLLNRILHKKGITSVDNKYCFVNRKDESMWYIAITSSKEKIAYVNQLEIHKMFTHKIKIFWNRKTEGIIQLGGKLGWVNFLKIVNSEAKNLLKNILI